VEVLIVGTRCNTKHSNWFQVPHPLLIFLPFLYIQLIQLIPNFPAVVLHQVIYRYLMTMFQLLSIYTIRWHVLGNTILTHLKELRNATNNWVLGYVMTLFQLHGLQSTEQYGDCLWWNGKDEEAVIGICLNKLRKTTKTTGQLMCVLDFSYWDLSGVLWHFI